MSSVNDGKQETKILTDKVAEYLAQIKKQHFLVEGVIDNVEDKEIQRQLRKAKEKAVEEETELLNSLQVLELSQILKSTLLLQTVFDESFASLKKEQEKAKSLHAPDIAEYERKPAPLTTTSSITSLLFELPHLYLPAFEKFIDSVQSECKKQHVKICNSPKASCKSIERAFYKIFYVFVGDYKKIKDLLRCSFVFDNFGDLYHTFSIIKKLANAHEAIKGGVLQVKDLYKEKQESTFGYRFLSIYVNCPGSNVVCEIQLNYQSFENYKNDSHYLFKRFRLFETNDGNIAYKYAINHILPTIEKKKERFQSLIHSNDKTQNYDEKQMSTEDYDERREGETKSGEKKIVEIEKSKETNEKWYLNNFVSIKTCHNTYLRASPGKSGSKVDLQTRVGQWEKFFVVPKENDKVAFRSCHGTFIRASPGGEGSKVDLQTQIGEWELFKIIPVDSKWAIQSCKHSTYLRAHPGGEGSKVDLQTKIGKWEVFQIEKIK